MNIILFIYSSLFVEVSRVRETIKRSENNIWSDLYSVDNMPCTQKDTQCWLEEWNLNNGTWFYLPATGHSRCPSGWNATLHSPLSLDCGDAEKICRGSKIPLSTSLSPHPPSLQQIQPHRIRGWKTGWLSLLKHESLGFPFSVELFQYLILKAGA